MLKLSKARVLNLNYRVVSLNLSFFFHLEFFLKCPIFKACLFSSCKETRMLEYWPKSEKGKKSSSQSKPFSTSKGKEYILALSSLVIWLPYHWVCHQRAFQKEYPIILDISTFPYLKFKHVCTDNEIRNLSDRRTQYTIWFARLVVNFNRSSSIVNPS